MANTPTTNFGYNKPAIGDRGWGVTLNGNWDALDTDFAVEHRSGSGNDGKHGPKVTIEQSGADNALVISKTNTGAGEVVTITNSGTASSLTITNNNTSNQTAQTINGSGNLTAISITKSNTGNANVIEIINSGTGYALGIQQVGDQRGINVVSNSSNQQAVYASGKYAISAQLSASGGYALYLSDTASTVEPGSSYGLMAVNKAGTGSSPALVVNNSGTGPSVYVVGGVPGLHLVNAGAHLETTNTSGDIQMTFKRTGDPDMYFTYWGQSDYNTLALTNGSGQGVHVNTSGKVIISDLGASRFDGTGRLVVLDGNVGIGNRSPTSLLQVDQTAEAVALQINTSATDNQALRIVGKYCQAIIPNASSGYGLVVQTTNSTHEPSQMIWIYKTGTGSNPVMQIDNSGTGADVLINKNANGIGIDINSSATNAPLIDLASSAGNNRGDIKFSTSRTSDPSTTTEGDFWYNTTDNVFKYYDGSTVQTLGTGSGGGSLQDAYDVGSTISGTAAIEVTQSSGGNVSALTIAQNHTGNGANVVTISGSGGGNALYVRQSTEVGEGILVDLGTTYSDNAGIGLNVNSRSTANSSGPLLVLTKGYTDTFTGNIAVALIKQSSAGGTQPILKIQEEGLGNSTYGIIDIVANKSGNQAIGIRIHHSASTAAVSATSNAQAILIDFQSSKSGEPIVQIDNTRYASPRSSLEINSSSTGTAGTIYVNQMGDGAAVVLSQTNTSATNHMITITNGGSGRDVSGNGGNWYVTSSGAIKLGVVGSASRPTAAIGLMVWDSNVGAPIIYDGAAWVKVVTTAT